MLDKYTNSELLMELINRKALVVDEVTNLQTDYIEKVALIEYRMRSVIRGGININGIKII